MVRNTAPLIVPNASGSRPCEKAIGTAFGRFDAGAYPANRGNPLFDPPRGARLADRHGWSLDPSSSDLPLAIEVYPHPGMVGLFTLPRVLPYKSRPSRTVDSRREAFAELCEHMQRLPDLALSYSARWALIREEIEQATRPVHLERIEDEVDAIFCAHLAWLWGTCRNALEVYGDVQNGYIVAPPAPAWDPGPRAVTPKDCRMPAIHSPDSS